MNSGRSVFSQLIDFCSKREFNRIVEKYSGDLRVRNFSCWDQFLCMAFAQLTYRESLRDIEACLRALGSKLYHNGIKGKVSRSTLADANNKRDWRIFAEFAHLVLSQATKLYANEKLGVDLKTAAYCLDASVINLCLALCPWSKFDHTSRGGVKLHALLNLRGNIPSFIALTPRKTYELEVLDEIDLESGAFYIMDRGYFDWRRLYRIHQSQAFFIIRLRKGITTRRRYSLPVDKSTGVQSDHIVAAGRANLLHESKKYRAALLYPEEFRRVRYYDETSKKYFTFMTNNKLLPAKTIADLYRMRWQVEIFFKWIKQHLRIKTFFGTSLNAIKIQIYVAITIYALMAIMKKRLDLKQQLYAVLQIVSITCFEKTPLNTLFSRKITDELQLVSKNPAKQLDLWGF